MPLGKIIWNQTCKEHFWLPPDAEIDFDLFYSIIHPDDREATQRAVEEAVFGRQPYDVEYRTVAPDGRVRWVRAKGRAYYDVGGNPTRFDGVTLDVTERRRAEEAMRESEAAFRQLADAMPQIVWAAVRRRHRLLQPPLVRVHRPARRRRRAKRRGTATSTPTTCPASTRRGRRRSGPDRRTPPSSACARQRGVPLVPRPRLPVRDAGGNTTRWFGTCTDIDDQRRATELLQDATARASGTRRSWKR